MTVRPARIVPGAEIVPGITAVAALDPDARHPVHIVWNHESWCPMACKIFGRAQRARREADILRSLSHPNIVRFLGMTAGGNRRVCLLMEFLEGATLGQLIRQGPQRRLSVSDSLRVAIHIGSALAHMHGRGYLHLDVKPANVIVVHGRPVLFDVGIARARADWTKRFVEGTDGYMAPEQADGRPVTPATDVFGLGATLYEMLTGRLPFSRSNGATGTDKSRRTTASVRRHRQGVPAGLDELVQSCLANDPANRPPSLPALMVRLHGYIRSGSAMWPPTIAGHVNAALSGDPYIAS